MNCNCNNKNNSMKEAKIKHVFGNVLRIAIPLTLRTVELVDVDVDGEIEQQAQVTDTDFIPSSDYPVNVVFNKGAVKVSLKAQMRDGNIAYVEDKGKISVGTYDITVTCNDNDGNPYRFKQNTILQIVDATADAGIATPIEYEVTTWYLDAAIYLVMKGEDGVGIEDIITESSGEIGGVNTITFVLTNGETRSFTILNGSGSVDSDFDENSLHPLSNSVITNKFKSIDANIAGLFGDVDYDSSSKILRFWDITKSTILATIDARPFVKDGMVNRVYIQNRTLVITFNTDSGHDTIAISLDSVFNPNNYYTKTQVDSRIASAVANINLSNYYTKAQTDAKLSQKVNLDATTGRVDASQATRVVLDYIVGIYDGEDEPSHDVNAGDVWYDNGQIYYAYNNDVIVVIISLGAPQKDIIYCNAENNKLYRWNGSEFVQVGGSGSGSGYEPPVGGIPKSDLASGVQASLGKADTALQSSDLEGYATTDDVDDAVAALVSSAPQTLDTLKELADALGDDPNFATTMATQLGNKVDKETGKGLSTNDYTTAEKTKLAGLENYDDSALQTAIDGKVDKESGKSLMTDAEHTKLAGIAAGAEVNVQPNWTQTNTSADDYIKNKPTLATVATSGSYNDLQDKPNIPAGVTVDQEITQNGTNPVKGGAIYDALENTKTFIVNVTIDYVNDTITADKTFAEINAAISGGRVVEVNHEGDIYLLAVITPFVNQFYFVYSSPEDSSRCVLSVTKRDVWARETMLIATTGLLQNYVPVTRKINSKPLVGDLELTASDVGALPSTTVIPAAQIQSDWNQTTTTEVDYIKNKPDLSTFATKSEVNAKQDTINDLDAIRSGAALGATALQSFTETDPTVPSWAKQQTKPTYTAQEVGALPATTTIPTKTSDLTNDSGFIDKAMYYGESTTAAATMPKVCTVETFPTTTSGNVTHAKEGTIIAVKFTNSDTNTTDAPELNVNGIGAKAIMYNNAIVTSTAKNTTIAGYAKQIAYYRYDPDLDEGNGAWEYLGKSVDSNSTYSNASLGQGYATQTNGSAATAITASISSYALSDGGIVTIKFTYDVPANATLNISSKGEKAIYNQGAAITAGVIKAGDTATFIYSTYYHLLSVDSWQDSQGGSVTVDSTPTSGSTNAVSSGGVYTALAGKADTSTTYTKSEIDTKIGNIETLLASI